MDGEQFLISVVFHPECINFPFKTRIFLLNTYQAEVFEPDFLCAIDRFFNKFLKWSGGFDDQLLSRIPGPLPPQIRGKNGKCQENEKDPYPDCSNPS